MLKTVDWAAGTSPDWITRSYFHLTQSLGLNLYCFPMLMCPELVILETGRVTAASPVSWHLHLLTVSHTGVFSVSHFTEVVQLYTEVTVYCQ